MSKSTEKLAEGTLISHLLELRNRLVKAAAAVAVIFAPAIYFRNEIFENLAKPLVAQLPQTGALIATSVMSPFITPIKLAFFFAVFAAMPVVLYQIWAFVAPGLYRREKRFAIPLLVSSILLFYVGVYFAYQFVFPTMFRFLASKGPANMQMMPDINNFLDFALTTFLAFGVAFEVPVVVVLLVLTGLVHIDTLKKSRGYVIIGIFVVAAVLTPPDPLSQIMMAIPMWLLYEAGLLMARMMGRKQPVDATADDNKETA
ncbi:MAG: twin-arginine translocase subunit TatC [Nevskiaceae bacterium]|jgi:sec-independent protein translocase protein TatC|nr:twin-arginine translocase subunit TatC [Nevskiaceae bacterium]